MIEIAAGPWAYTYGDLVRHVQRICGARPTHFVAGDMLCQPDGTFVRVDDAKCKAQVEAWQAAWVAFKRTVTLP